MVRALKCDSLVSSAYLAPNEIRGCCKRFHINGELKGDLKLIDLKKDNNITFEKILNSKKKVLEEINSSNFSKEHPCYGCPWIVEDKNPSKIKITHISFETESICNMRCSYCSEVYYGGEKAIYDVKKLLEDFQNHISNDEISIVFGGGEPVLNKDFKYLLDYSLNNFNIKSLRIFTNSTIKSEDIKKYIDMGKIFITTSIDAGKAETFKKIRGINAFEKVFKNLNYYAQNNPSQITIKYIFSEGNTTQEEVDLYIAKIKEERLESCSFQVSSDFKNDYLNLEQIEVIKSLKEKLDEISNGNTFLDDHLAPRLIAGNKDKLFKSKGEQYIVWGAGEHAKRIYERLGVENVSFFIDSYKKDELLLNRKIYGPKSLINNNLPIYIASVQAYPQIKKIIENMGQAERIITEPY